MNWHSHISKLKALRKASEARAADLKELQSQAEKEARLRSGFYNYQELPIRRMRPEEQEGVTFSRPLSVPVHMGVDQYMQQVEMFKHPMTKTLIRSKVGASEASREQSYERQKAKRKKESPDD